MRLEGGSAKLAWHFDAGHRDSDDYEIPGFAHADLDVSSQAHAPSNDLPRCRF